MVYDCPLSVHKHEQEHAEARYIPDPFIDGITKELEAIEEADRKQREDSAEVKEAKAAAKEKAKLAKLYAELDDEDD